MAGCKARATGWTAFFKLFPRLRYSPLAIFTINPRKFLRGTPQHETGPLMAAEHLSVSVGSKHRGSRNACCKTRSFLILGSSRTLQALLSQCEWGAAPHVEREETRHTKPLDKSFQNRGRQSVSFGAHRGGASDRPFHTNPNPLVHPRYTRNGATPPHLASLCITPFSMLQHLPISLFTLPSRRSRHERRSCRRRAIDPARGSAVRLSTARSSGHGRNDLGELAFFLYRQYSLRARGG